MENGFLGITARSERLVIPPKATQYWRALAGRHALSALASRALVVLEKIRKPLAKRLAAVVSKPGTLPILHAVG